MAVLRRKLVRRLSRGRRPSYVRIALFELELGWDVSDAWRPDVADVLARHEERRERETLRWVLTQGWR